MLRIRQAQILLDVIIVDVSSCIYIPVSSHILYSCHSIHVMPEVGVVIV